MNPLVIIIFIILGLLGVYLLMTELGTAQSATGAVSNSTSASLTTWAINILMAVMILYAIYYVAEVIKNSSRERRKKERKKQDREAREAPRKF